MANKKSPPKMEIFTFGDPVPVLDGMRGLGYYYHSYWNGRYYDPPTNFEGLAQSFNANVHHQSAIRIKVNIVASSYQPHPLLPRADFARLVLDYLVFGNTYVERRNDRAGRPLALRVSPAKYTRRMQGDAYLFLAEGGVEHQFAENTVFHLLQPDIN